VYSTSGGGYIDTLGKKAYPSLLQTTLCSLYHRTPVYAAGTAVLIYYPSLSISENGAGYALIRTTCKASLCCLCSVRLATREKRNHIPTNLMQMLAMMLAMTCGCGERRPPIHDIKVQQGHPRLVSKRLPKS
jgi:hypothetical protein